MSRKLTKLTGEPKEQLQESKIKDNVVHVGLSLPPVPLKDLITSKTKNYYLSQNNN